MATSKSCKQKLYGEVAMSRKTSPPSIPLPKNWTGHVKSAMLHVIAFVDPRTPRCPGMVP